jgi:hypothetical protein
MVKGATPVTSPSISTLSLNDTSLAVRTPLVKILHLNFDTQRQIASDTTLKDGVAFVTTGTLLTVKLAAGEQGNRLPPQFHRRSRR